MLLICDYLPVLPRLNSRLNANNYPTEWFFTKSPVSLIEALLSPTELPMAFYDCLELPCFPW